MASTAKVAPTSLEPNNDKSKVLSTRERSEVEIAKKTPHPMLQKMFVMMEGRLWQTFITSLTVFALFGDDFRVCFFAPSTDDFFYSLSLLSMIMFSLELVVYTICKPGYYKSFYFVLDIVATVTLITDIGFIWNPFLDVILSSADSTTSSQSADVSDALQASRVGTKSSRIVRIVRLVRLVRVVKLYKVSKGEDEVDDALAEENPSLVGKKLSDKTMQRVITVVLAMLICVQFFNVDMWITPVNQGTYGLYRLNKRVQLADSSNSTTFTHFLNTDLKDEIQDYTRGLEGGILLYLSLYGTNEYEEQILDFVRTTKFPTDDGQYVFASEDLDYTPSTAILNSVDAINAKFRSSEYVVSSADNCFDFENQDLEFPMNFSCSSYAYFDIRASVRLSAGLNITQTLFVMCVLTFGSLLFSSDAETLVIKPIEKMVISVKMLAENPMGNTELAELPNPTGDDDNADETVLLQRTIAKIGTLLQIGFGEAGSEIIAKNMQSNSGIEPMCDGVKIEAVFGFCDIRNFTDTTECLQESVMVYVNKVGAIVHEATHSWYGAANKNIGDAFLLVWKVKSGRKGMVGNLCDNALVAFLKSMIDLKRENGPGGCLHDYKDHAMIRKRFGEDNFEIKLGMGLHIGWAIEGTIGSRFKIDASYLSPNVNMASRLEAATKQFKTPLLLSEDFFDALSSKARKRCRQIDRVTVKGSIQPMSLFTCDIIEFPEEFGVPQFDAEGNRLAFNFEGPEMEAIHTGMPEGFLDDFKAAVANYLAGDWALCKSQLDDLLVKKPEDGPSVSLMEVMEKTDFKVPSDWKGYRALTEK